MTQTQLNPQADVNGTSLMDAIDISYDELVERLGAPHSDGDGYKVDAEWCFDTPAGSATLYNYNDGEGSIHDIRDWHIGGKTEAVVSYVTSFIRRGI